KGGNWYIKNFDYTYRSASIRTPAPSEGAPVKPLVGKAAEGAMDYVVAIRHYRPFWVTFEHVTKWPACEATALVTLDPGNLLYFRQPIAFKGSIRVTVPAARSDIVNLSVSPAACAGVTRYEVTRDPPPGMTETPDLFTYLLARRLHPGDELYNVDEDPEMLRNLPAADARQTLDRELRALYEAN